MFLNKDELNSLREFKLGTGTLSPQLAEFKNWFESRYGTALIGVTLDRIIVAGVACPRLLLFTDTAVECQTLSRILGFRSHNQEDEAPLDEFRRICREAPIDPNYNLNRLFYSLIDCETEMHDHAVCEFHRNEKDRVIEEFAELPIWRIEGLEGQSVIFYYRDSEIVRYRESGDSLRIWRRCFELTKKYDEFNYITRENFRVNFDSKEHVDKKFAGNLFYYSRNH